MSAPKGSVAHQIEMAVVRETLRKAIVPPDTVAPDLDDDDGVDGIHRFTCDECNGSGREWEGWPCDACAGTGYLDV